MVVDTSALMAILLAEAEEAAFRRVIFATAAVAIAAPTRFEFLMVASSERVAGVRPAALAEAQAMLSHMEVETMPFDEAHVALAHTAFLRFGKGRGHPAQLNFGDCMSYALARALDVPLLYKGRDFAMTDIRAAL